MSVIKGKSEDESSAGASNTEQPHSEPIKGEPRAAGDELSAFDQKPKPNVGGSSPYNSDFGSLINSTAIAAILLDNHLKVNHFSPRARDVFGLQDSDIGRPLNTLRGQLENGDLEADVQSVLRTLRLVEREVRSTDGRTYLMQLTPYRTAENVVNGVIIALFDISKRVRAEADLRAAHAEVTEILESIGDAFFAVDLDWNFTYVNQRAERFMDRRREELLGKSLWKVFRENEEPQLFEKLREADSANVEQTFKAFSPKLSRWVEVSVFPGAAGRYLYFRDITERQRREENLAFLAEINTDLAGD